MVNFMNKALKIFFIDVLSKCVYLLLLFSCAEDLMTQKSDFENTKDISQVNNNEASSCNIQFTLKNWLLFYAYRSNFLSQCSI